MDTSVRTPHAVFMMPQRFLVPLFQRPYVWNEELQWEPLWKDIQRIANRMLNDPQVQHQPHFLGAVVLQQIQNPAGDLQQRTIIDGQQRLTTLQLILDAIHSELSLVGANSSAARILPLIENAEPFQRNPEDKFKVWPTNKDRDAFNEVMGKHYEIQYENLIYGTHRLVLGHRYFSHQVRTWLREEGDLLVIKRAEMLEKTVRELLQLVVIDLAPQENAQEIFETLNARGAVLTAADLIKNFIFQRLLEQGTDVEKAYDKYWRNFETAFWEEEVSTGRVKYQRSSLFINQWLIAKTGEEIVAREVFSRFKLFADFEAGSDMLLLLEQIHKAANSYKEFNEQSMNQESNIDPIGLFAYRLRVMEMDAVRPLVMALMDPDEIKIPQIELENCFRAIESWLVRRLLVRATTKAYNKIIPDLIMGLKRNRSNACQFIEEFLRTQSADSSYWPDDTELTNELLSLQFYRRIYRSRARMILEALEDHARGWIDNKESLSGTRIKRQKYVIEHLMPRSWQTNWPLPKSLTESDRDELVHTLGNLTLLSTKLNSKISNGAWSDKKKSIKEHDLLQLNKQILEIGKNSWTDHDIRNRTQYLISKILQIWPCPTGHKVNRTNQASRWSSSVTVSDLLAAGLLSAGQTLYSQPGKYGGFHAVILNDGRIETNGKVFDSLSMAGWEVRGRATNGWTFWKVDLQSQTCVNDLRREYESVTGSELLESSEDYEDEE
jgi:Protein of unknown function DUF262/Protein of unknown function (DUF1524)/Restriction Enzyme Adenine Methylase Associated